MHRKRFTVEGSGAFPFDMLRYDECFPREGSDARALTYPGMRRVRLDRNCRYKSSPTCTAGRWESFGWRVTEVED